MKIDHSNIKVLFVVLLAGFNQSLSAQAPISFEKALEAAESQSQHLQIQDAEIKRLESRYLISRGAVWPDLRWIRTETFQDTSSNSSSSSEGVSSTLLKSRRPESYFQLKQPIFSGFRDYHTLKILKATTEESQWQLAQARLQLVEEVGDVFYTLLSGQEEIRVLGETLKTLQGRETELKRRMNLGQSRPSEILSVQTEVLSLQAQIEESKRNQLGAWDAWEYLTGLPAESTLSDTQQSPPALSLEETLKLAAQHPDIQRARAHVSAAESQTRLMKGAYWPVIDLTGKYYTERVGFQSKTKWDAVLKLDLPLFEGLRTKYGVEESNLQLKQAQLELLQAQKARQQLIKTRFHDWTSFQKQAEFYAQAIARSDENYEKLQKEYRLGLINNLELLRFLTDRQSLYQNALRVQYLAKSNYIRLQAAIGLESGSPFAKATGDFALPVKEIGRAQQ